MNKILPFSLLILLLYSCGKKPTSEQLLAWEQWKTERTTELKSADGFLNLAGLYWLQPGEQTIGSGENSNILLPAEWPENAGTIRWENDLVVFENMAAGISIDGSEVHAAVIYDPNKQEQPTISFGSFRAYTIARAGDIGIRLKDLKHPALSAPLPITYFPFHTQWQVEARYVPYTIAKTLKVENVIGHLFELEIPGQLIFDLKGKTYTLEPIPDGDKWFIIFSDETSAVETYGSGRYLYAKKATEGEKTFLDFNQSYNPPCAFTPFATCWLPPRENHLPIRITAGELDFHLETE